MAIDYKNLPVYQQKDLILKALEENQVIVVQSPTGSGKTTQIPVILHEAGYDQNGIIAVTQPRRIAALSVSEYISKQLGTSYPGLVGYKMRFEDKTDDTTKIKIMTDGILLQEMKLDPWLSKYSVIMVDEAHERSLNIDFVLGLLKRVLEVRKEFKVIVSSATMNAEAFSSYFGNCPIVTIETITFPVTLIYDPPRMPASTLTDASSEQLIHKIADTVEKVLNNDDEEAQGGILIFLPGEKIIKDCMKYLDHSHFASRIFTLPLYGRLSKEDQERVFMEAPEGRKKIIISTNIAETSVTISDITTVIDSGLAKLNFYNPRTFTSSLIETQVSKASLNQRKGRAGRTQKGLCYRLYSIKDFETRQMYTTEEIYRTDLSEVVLQMADLGITDFMGFDFISHPGKEGIIGAVETLNMLGALSPDNTLSSIGKMMVNFPLEPRISRIIVEAIMRFPDVLEEVLIAASFLSTNSPYMLPPGEEIEARKAHHRYQDIQGDFVSYLNLFKAFTNCQDKEKFAQDNYLDLRILLEIDNINSQLQDIIYHMNIPVTGGGDKAHYLSCIASGMIQFVCIRSGKDTYRSLTTDRINIHPGSSMFRKDPLYIVAGEIVRTSRMFAMSVSPLTTSILNSVAPTLLSRLDSKKGAKKLEKQSDIYSETLEKSKKRGKESAASEKAEKVSDDVLIFGDEKFSIKKIKGRKTAILPFEKFSKALQAADEDEKSYGFKGVCGKIEYSKGFYLFDDIKLPQIIKFAELFSLKPIDEKSWNRKLNININDKNAAEILCEHCKNILKIAVAKQKEKAYGVIALFTDGKGNYWSKISKGLHTAVNESLYSLETLSETEELFTEDQKETLNEIYRKLNEII